MNIKVWAELASARARAQKALERAFAGTLSGPFGGRSGVGYWIDMVLPDGVTLADAKETVAEIEVTVEERD